MLTRTLAGALVATVATFAFSGVAAAQTFTYAGPSVPIPDSPGANVAGTTASAVIPVAGVGGSGKVSTVTVTIGGTACSTTSGDTANGIDHTFVNDLQIDLKSPTGTIVTIINRTDGGANNFCQVVLDDASAGPSIQTALAAQAPFTGSWQPANPLAAFAGEAADGNWTLMATDFFVGDTGNINAWSVTIVPSAAPAAQVPTLSEWSMILLASLLALVGVVRLRSRPPG